LWLGSLGKMLRYLVRKPNITQTQILRYMQNRKNTDIIIGYPNIYDLIEFNITIYKSDFLLSLL
jgi:hypothetical protein